MPELQPKPTLTSCSKNLRVQDFSRTTPRPNLWKALAHKQLHGGLPSSTTRPDLRFAPPFTVSHLLSAPRTCVLDCTAFREFLCLDIALVYRHLGQEIVSRSYFRSGVMCDINGRDTIRPVECTSNDNLSRSTSMSSIHLCIVRLPPFRAREGFSPSADDPICPGL